MRIHVLTIFPDQFGSFLNHPLVARSVVSGELSVMIHDIREYADGSFRHIDDSPFGGGAGMILKCEPVFRCLDEIKRPLSHVIAFTPCGKTLRQSDVRRLKEKEELILLCGHYEGFDQRILDSVDEEISMGDYILSGGELPAMTLIDAISRLCQGTIRKDSTEDESFEKGLLEYPQYTRPQEFRGMRVPEVLLSGHQENIRKWKKKEALRKTLRLRPDLLAAYEADEEAQRFLEEIRNETAMD